MIRSIIIIVAVLVALKYFLGFDLIDLLSEGNYGEVWLWIKINVWQKFFLDIVWTKISVLLQKVTN